MNDQQAVPTIEEQELEIIKYVADEVCLAESVEECFGIIEKGKQKMNALKQQNPEDALHKQNP